MRKIFRFFRGFHDMFSGAPELAAGLIVAIVLAVGCLVAVLAMPFVENVEHGEVVVCEPRFGGETKVWRGWLVDGWHWQGLGKVTTYHAEAGRKFSIPIEAGGAAYVVRGVARFRVFGDDAKILSIHRTYGSEDAIASRLVLPAVREAVEQAAADPHWARLEGGLVERKLKGALEYGLKRVSPTGAVWTSHETRRALQDDLNARLVKAHPPSGIPLTVELGFVTER